MNTTTTTTKTRFRGERGIAIIMTALCLLPLMAFAAFGVDLASFYSRASFLQKSADAAALAGTVWMPNLTKSTEVACDSLKNNGIDGGDCGTTDGPFEIAIAQGATANSLRVTITDPNATRYFSQVISSGNQRLTRTAEAEYNLPLPLGSPLNYFGGDADRTEWPAPPREYDVAWPTDYTTRAPSNSPCNVGAAAEGKGRWGGTPPTHQSGQNTSGTGNRLCTWSPVTTTVSTAFASNTSATLYAPSNIPCNRLQAPSSSQGRWNTGGTYSNNRFTGTPASGNQQCNWVVMTASADAVPTGYASSKPPPNSSRGCNVPAFNIPAPHAQPPAFGRWPVAPGGFQQNQYFTSGIDNRLCVWNSVVTFFDPPTPPNPISPNRSPGFWGVIRGPGDVTDLGDAFSVRCRGSSNANCGSATNAAYRNSGYWYVIKMPAADTTTTTIRLFDAAYNDSINDSGGAGPAADQGGDFSSGNGFTTTYRLYKQNSVLDFTDRTAVSSCPALSVQGQTSYAMTWTNLCTITPSNSETYLLNVTTSGSTGDLAGANGYALEAVASGGPEQQPAVYAYADMAMRTQKDGPGNASFYLAEVGPQHAGKTLVVQLYDAGDFTGGVATVRPLMPKTGTAPTFNWTNVPSADCRYTSSPAPNNQYGSVNNRDGTSTAVITPTQPTLANCAVTTQSGTGSPGYSTRRFNDTWLTIKVAIPTTYTCTPGLNPELVSGTCWWGIRYDYDADAGETTTWRARVEGNPVHLTQ